jgi:hypothetical protein
VATRLSLRVAATVAFFGYLLGTTGYGVYMITALQLPVITVVGLPRRLVEAVRVRSPLPRRRAR